MIDVKNKNNQQDGNKEMKNKEIDNGKNKKEIQENEKNNYNFIIKILKDNIGNEIDNFLNTNMKQVITKYNADSFARYAILALEKSKQEIVNEFKRILKNN